MIRKNLWGEEIEIETKECSMCKSELPITSFGRESTYLRAWCKKCTIQYNRDMNEIRKTAPELPTKDYRCPICLKSESELTWGNYTKKNKRIWVLDHDHESKTFRGWLCQKCNFALGNFGDDPERCIRAAQYITNHAVETY